MWTLLAACAGMLLLVPVITLGAAAARMGALGRDQRLATLRLLGLTGGQAVALSTLETMLAAIAGGLVGRWATWSACRRGPRSAFRPRPWAAGRCRRLAGDRATWPGLALLAGLSSVTGLMRMRISPLGVARRAPRPMLKLWRLLAVPVVIGLWLLVAPVLSLSRQVLLATVVISIALGGFMAVVNLIGPGFCNCSASGCPGRDGRPCCSPGRLQADPKSAWRRCLDWPSSDSPVAHWSAYPI